MLRIINSRTASISKLCRSTLNIGTSILPYSSQESDKYNEDIILLRHAVCPSSQAFVSANTDDSHNCQQTSLAGDPRSIFSVREEIRAEVLEKWNQRPQATVNRDWAKYSIHY